MEEAQEDPHRSSLIERLSQESQVPLMEESQEDPHRISQQDSHRETLTERFSQESQGPVMQVSQEDTYWKSQEDFQRNTLPQESQIPINDRPQEVVIESDAIVAAAMLQGRNARKKGSLDAGRKSSFEGGRDSIMRKLSGANANANADVNGRASQMSDITGSLFSSESGSLCDPNDAPDPEPQWLVNARQDPWCWVRLALGNLAGESWRLRQALQWPGSSWKLLEIKRVTDEEDGPEEDWCQRYEKMQSFDAFKLAMPFRPNSKTGVIDVIYVGTMETSRYKLFHDFLFEILESFLGFKIRVRQPNEYSFHAPGDSLVELEDWAKPRKQEEGTKQEFTQYEAGVILQRLEECADQRSVCTIALVREDLYLGEKDELQYITGAVDSQHRIGLFSAARYYAANFDSIERPTHVKIAICLLKMICREVLKILGVEECTLLECVMNQFPGTMPEDVKELPMHLCCVCLRKLQWASQVDLLDRYAQLPPLLIDWFPAEADWIWDRMQKTGMPTYASFQSVRRGLSMA